MKDRTAQQRVDSSHPPPRPAMKFKTLFSQKWRAPVQERYHYQQQQHKRQEQEEEDDSDLESPLNGLEILHKHFKIVDRLGQGAFATVYQAKRRLDGNYYALKHIDIHAAPDDFRKDLVNEIRLLASLDHPNIVSYLEAFVDQAQLFIVTELLGGGDLRALIKQRAQTKDWMPEELVWTYFIQIALGLKYLHHSSILHGDLKSSNVLIGEGGLLKIADLGISQLLTHVFTRVLMGTPNYFSPQMFCGEPFSYSADIWALGCVLHEMCSLRPLFLGRTEEQIREKVLSGQLLPIPSQYSQSLWDLITHMLQQSPADRPTIDEILALPEVRNRAFLLPRVDWPYMDRVHQSQAEVLGLIRVSTIGGQWDKLNERLPPARYTSGFGVVESLSLRRPSSCSDLAGLEEQQYIKGQQQQQQQMAAAGAAAGVPAGPPAHLFRFSTCCPWEEGWVVGERLRRKSSTGPLLQHKLLPDFDEDEGEGGSGSEEGAQLQDGPAAAAGTAGAAGAAGAAAEEAAAQAAASPVASSSRSGNPAPLRRVKSEGDLGKARAATTAATVASSMPWAGAGATLDPKRPLLLGASEKLNTSRSTIPYPLRFSGTTLTLSTKRSTGPDSSAGGSSREGTAHSGTLWRNASGALMGRGSTSTGEEGGQWATYAGGTATPNGVLTSSCGGSTDTTAYGGTAVAAALAGSGGSSSGGSKDRKGLVKLKSKLKALFHQQQAQRKERGEAAGSGGCTRRTGTSEL